jgi:hypothetical protein
MTAASDVWQHIANLLIALPWLFGGVSIVLLGRLQRRVSLKKYPHLAWDLPSGLLFGVGGVIGVIGWSSLLRILGTEYLAAGCIALFACLTLAVPLFANPSFLGDKFRSIGSLRLLDKTLLASIFVIIIFAYFHQAQVPSFAYDSLFLWNWNAAELLKLSPDQASEYLEIYDHKHPITNVLVSLWGGWSAVSFGGGSPGLPWLLGGISSACVSASYINSHTQDITRSLLGALVTLTIPLVEDHYILYGYADLWVAVTVFSSTVIIGLAVQYHDKAVLVAGLLLAGLCVVIKQAGVGYSVCIWLAAIFAVGRVWLVYIVFALVMTVALSIAALGTIGTLDFGVVKLSAELSPLTVSATIFGWEMSFASLGEVVTNQLYAFLVNGSFSVLFIAIVVYIFFSSTDSFATRSVSDKKPHLGLPVASKLIFLSVFLIFSMLVASQVLIPYGFEHARPGQDTGNSRFSLPVFLPIAAILFSLVKVRKSFASRVAL